jgi:hypothetical protein
LQQQFGTVVGKVAPNLVPPLLHFLWHWAKLIAVCFGLTLFVLMSWEYVRQFQQRPLTFLLGPPGGDSANQATGLQAEFDKHSIFGSNYLLTPVNTDGYLENYRRVAADHEGKIVGLAMDGYRDRGRGTVQTILPLDWEYLHFLCTISSLRDLGILHEASQQDRVPSEAASISPTVESAAVPISFTKWVRAVRLRIEKRSAQLAKGMEVANVARLPKIYFGPRGSGTRMIAEAVLEFANIPSDEVEATGIGDFQEMLVELRQDAIGGSFYLGPHEASSIAFAAENIPCTLISFDNSEFLEARFPYLMQGAIPASTYHFSRSEIDKELNSNHIDTVAVRRVIIAPKAMKARYAYDVALRAKEFFYNSVAHSSDGVPTFKGPAVHGGAKPLEFEHHAGSPIRLNGIAPPSWFDRNVDWLGPLVVSVMLAMLAEWTPAVTRALNRLAGRSDVTPSPVPAPADEPAGDEIAEIDAEIDTEIDTVLKELHETGDKLCDEGKSATKTELSKWQRRIKSVGQRIRAAQKSGQLADESIAKLRSRERRMWQELFVLANPPWPTPAPRKPTAKKSTKSKAKQPDERPDTDETPGSGA